MKHNTLLSILMVVLLACLGARVQAQNPFELTTTTAQVTQDFDGMYDGTAATLTMPAGWKVDRNMTASRTIGSYAGAATEVMYTGGTSLASNAKNGTWNLVSSSDPTDCSVGGISTGVADATRCNSVMTAIKNSDTKAINSLAITYDVEKYRYGSHGSGFEVQLYTSLDGSTWTSAGANFRTFFAADAATEGAATVPISTTPVSNNLSVNIVPDATLYLAWNITVATDNTTMCNNAQVLSVDNIDITATFDAEEYVPDVIDVDLNNTQVTQDFDGMYDGTNATLTMPAGWKVERNLSAPRTVGAFDAASKTVMYSGGISLASNASNGTWNFGSSSDASDRAIGGLSTTVADGTRCVNIMTAIRNNADEAISKLDLAYDIEKYRDGDNPEGFVVQLYTSSDGVTWTSAGEDFRNFFSPDAATAGAATVPISTTAVSGKSLMVNIAPDNVLYLAWNISVAGGTSPNKAMGLSLDNVVIDATFASQMQGGFVYVEDVTKWRTLVMSTNGGTAEAPTTTAVVNGVNYKVWPIAKDGQTYTLTFSDNSSNSIVEQITADRDYYFCLTADGATEIADPQTYTGWVDPTRPPFVASGIYLRGEVNSWGTPAEWEFSDEGNGVYALYDKTLSGNFKIADASWSSACNYGSNGSSILMDEDYTLVLNTNDNISCGGYTFVCPKITLTIADGTATLYLKSDDSEAGVTSVYVIGDNNSWNYMDTSGELTLDENNNDLFKGQITLFAGSNNMSQWRIYMHLGMGGVWGAASDLTGNNLTGTLVKGNTGKVSTNPGTYEFTFNIATGQFTLQEVASEAVSISLKPADVVLVPELPEQVKVLSLNNSLIYYNDQDAVFNNIATAMGKDAVWTKHTLLGKTLKTHWDEGDGLAEDGTPGAKMLVRSNAWSHIILQEQSALPRTDIETFRANVKRWVDYIREYCPNPNAIIILPVNWAYSGDWGNYTDFNTTFVKNYKDVALDLGVTICPVGVAYQAVYDTEGSEGTATWFLDDRHPTLKATYMAAAMEYGLIFGEDPATINYVPSGMSAAEAASMRSYASNALNGFTNYVDHTAGVVRYKAALYDQFGMEIAPATPITMTVSGGGAIDANQVFTATGEYGTYDVNATSGEFSADATVKVAKAETVVVTYPAIELNEDNLSAAENFNTMGSDATATLPEAWRISRTLDPQTPRTVTRFDMADTQTMYSGGANLASNAKNGTWNFGADDASDRAIGGISTTVANGTRCTNVFAHILNTGAKDIVNLNVTYNVEKYRKGANPEGFDVQLYYSLDGRNWTSAGADFLTHFNPDSETIGYDNVPGETVAVDAILPTTLGKGCDLYLAWNITVAAGTSPDKAMALAIDDFTISGELPAIPDAKHYIYVNDQTGWDALGLYAWGDSEAFGTWPGEASVGDTDINGVNYKVFLLDLDGGNYHLIFNNWNNGSQLADYDIVADRDYYFDITSTGVTELASLDFITTEGVEGKTYRIIEDLALVVVTEDDSRAYVSNGNDGWIALRLDTEEANAFNAIEPTYAIKGSTITGVLETRDNKPTLNVTALGTLTDGETLAPEFIIQELELRQSEFTAPKPCQVVSVTGYVKDGRIYAWNNSNENTKYLTLASDYISSMPSFSSEQLTLDNVVIEYANATTGSGVRRKAEGVGFESLIGQLTSANASLTAVRDLNAGKSAASVKYVNMTGVESARPFDGLNIVVTTYTDGTVSVAKVMK